MSGCFVESTGSTFPVNSLQSPQFRADAKQDPIASVSYARGDGLAKLRDWPHSSFIFTVPAHFQELHFSAFTPAVKIMEEYSDRTPSDIARYQIGRAHV